MQFHHLGVVAASVESGKRHLEIAWSAELDRADRDRSRRSPSSSPRILRDPFNELIAPLDEQSPIMATLRSKKNILNHVAYSVINFEGGSSAFERSDTCPGPASRPPRSPGHGLSST